LHVPAHHHAPCLATLDSLTGVHWRAGWDAPMGKRLRLIVQEGFIFGLFLKRGQDRWHVETK
jgi:hypothetical protein